MAKSRGAGSKKTANKKATKKAASKKPAPKQAAKTGSAKKAPAKKTAKKPEKKAAKKTVAKRPAKAPAKKAAKPAAKKSTTAPKAKSTTTAPKAKRTTTAPKAKSTTAAPKAAKPAPRPAPKPAPVREPAEDVLEAVARIAEREPSREPVPRVTPTGPISAHPDAQLTQDQVEELYSKLVTERDRVIAGFDRHLSEALGETEVMPDETDMAQRSTEQAYLIRFADKERKLLSEIEHALEKMRTGEYGVCEGTEEPIGFKRLELRPWTRYSVGYKEQMERERSQHRR